MARCDAGVRQRRGRSRRGLRRCRTYATMEEVMLAMAYGLQGERKQAFHLAGLGLAQL